MIIKYVHFFIDLHKTPQKQMCSSTQALWWSPNRCPVHEHADVVRFSLKQETAFLTLYFFIRPSAETGSNCNRMKAH